MQRLNAATPKILSLIPIEQLLGASRVNGSGDASLCQRAMAGLRLGGGLAVDDWGNGRRRGDGSSERGRQRRQPTGCGGGLADEILSACQKSYAEEPSHVT